MKNKILFLANSSSGLYDFRGMLLEKLLEKAAVTVSTPAQLKADLLEDMGCKVVDTAMERRGLNPVKDLGLLLFYRKLVKREKPEMVVTYTIKPNIYGGMVCRLLKIPYAANITGLGTAFQGNGMLRRLVTVLYRMALKGAKVVFFENSANMELFVEEKIVRRERCCLLAGAGVNLERYPLAPYPADDGSVRFLFIGRVMKEKGVSELFSAMERLHSEGCCCSLDVLGYSEEDFDTVIRAGEAAGWLRCHGYQSDVRPFIEASHCFVLPSYHEGMANTNLECAAMGRPLITSNTPGCREAVIEGKTGLLCQPQDAESLYTAMKAFLNLSTDQRRAMGLAGRTHMEQVFDKRVVVEKTVAALYGTEK